MKKRLLLCAALFLLLALPCFAESSEDYAGALGADRAAEGLPPDAQEALGDMPVGGADLDGGLEKIWAFLRRHFREELSAALRPAAAVTAVAVCCSLGDPLALREAGRFDYVSFGGAVAAACASVADVRGVVAMGAETLQNLGDYSKALLPTLTTAAVSAGAVTSASAKYAAAALFSDVLLTLAYDLVFPLICAYVAAVSVGAALGTGQLSGAARLLHWTGKTFLKALTAVFTGYLALTGILAGGTDKAAVRAAKAALSAALPVVGAALSDASESLVAGAGLVRNAIGAFGLLAVLAAVILPVLRLALRYFLFKAVAAVAGAVAGPRLGGLVEAVSGAYGLVLGLVGTAAAVQFLSIVSLLLTVTG